MSFRKQLILGIGALIAVLMFCAAMSVATFWRSSNETSEVTSELLDQFESAHQVGVLSERLIASARGYLLVRDERERQLVLRVSGQLSRALSNASNELSSVTQVVELLAVRVAAARYAQQIFRLVEGPAGDEAGYAEHVRPARIALERAVSRMVESERRGAHELTRRSGQRVRLAGIILAIGCGLGTAIGIALALIVSRRLFGEYARGQAAARAANHAARARKELLDMASHDLRSPLHSMILGVDLIREEHGPLPHLATLEHAAQRMQKLVEGLLDASEAETTGLVLHREQTTAAELFESTVQLFAVRAERAGVRLSVARCPSDSIWVDTERVLQILSNLVSNALSFTPRGGEVSLEAVRDDVAIRLAVTDTGPGIPEQERASLFKSFYQAGEGRDQKRSRRGSVGLGLYIARSLVLAHGGRIGVDSAPGAGSTFWFEIPSQPPTHRAARP